MRLKSIKLAGFKSFVDPTIIYFPSNMCAIVGPNGCGKSNIIDAVRWVMGESSAKHLRGELITDVIFKGSKNRKPSAKASVEMIFDNSQGKLTGEYSAFSEISIKRLLTSDTKNFFYLNGIKCRRRDVMDIFLGTGLGPRSYSIISQGIISNLIESKPEELRIFIEEAAGISKYKERRKETEQRIRRTNENITRLNDIREELSSQVNRLKEQADTAIKYQSLQKKMRLKKALLLALKWRSLNQQSQSQKKTISEYQQKLEDFLLKQQALDANTESDRLKQFELNEKFQATQSILYEFNNKITKIEEAIRINEERTKELKVDLARTETSWQTAKDQMSADQEQENLLKNENIDLEPELELLKEKNLMLNNLLDSSEHKLNEFYKEYDKLNQKLYEPLKNSEAEKVHIQNSKKSLQQLTDRYNKLQAELINLQPNNTQKEISKLSNLLTELTLHLDIQQDQKSILERNIDSNKQQLDKLHNEQNQIKSELMKLDAKKTSLNILQKEFLNQGLFEKTWLQKNQLETLPQLIKKIDVESRWQSAVEMVLGKTLSAICCDTLPSLNTFQTFNNGELTLIQTSLTLTENLKFELPPLSEKLKSGHKLNHFIYNIFACDSVEKAFSLQKKLTPEQSIITPNGIWLSKNWIKISRKKHNDLPNLLAQRKELNNTETIIQQKKIELQEIENNMQQNKIILLENEEEYKQNNQQHEKLKQRHSQTNTDLQGQKIIHNQIIERSEYIISEIEDLNIKKQEEEEKREVSRIKLEQYINKIEENSTLKNALNRKKEELNKQRDQAKNDYHNIQNKIQNTLLKKQHHNSKLSSIKTAMQRLSQQTVELHQRSNNIEKNIDFLHCREQQNKEQLKTLLQEYKAQKEKVNESQKDIESINHILQNYEKDRRSIEQLILINREKLENVKINFQSILVNQSNIEEQIKEQNFDLQTLIKNLSNTEKILDCEKELSQLSTNLERLGAINLAAIDEYKIQLNRQESIDKHYNDLTSALEILNKAIQKIDKETKARFKNTFDLINLELQQLFPTVFGGGSAYLRLTTEDLLETGVTIMAQPPGKKNTTIHLLSGGEKALTAIALVFAIFKLNPSPFCMLDEVDAPLDDANVNRYNHIVSQMSDQVQFIFITHNKIAMQAAKQLIGITMSEPGVSRPVSVDIENALSIKINT